MCVLGFSPLDFNLFILKLHVCGDAATVHPERGPVSSGWGLEVLSRIGGADPCWDGDEGCFPTRVKVGAGDMTRRVLFPGPGRPS